MPASNELTEMELKQRQEAAHKHGAEGAMRRIHRGLPLAEDDRQRRATILTELGYDPDNLPAGAMGKLVALVADNLLLSERFQHARQWAAEQQDVQKWVNLAQKSGWRNDKSIGQLLELMRAQAAGDTGIIDAAISAAGGGNEQN